MDDRSDGGGEVLRGHTRQDYADCIRKANRVSENVPNQTSKRVHHSQGERGGVWVTTPGGRTTLKPKDNKAGNAIDAKLWPPQPPRRQLSEPRSWWRVARKTFASLSASLGMQTMSNVITARTSPLLNVDVATRDQREMGTGIGHRHHNLTADNYRHRQLNTPRAFHHHQHNASGLASTTANTSTNTTGTATTYSLNSSAVHLPSVEGSVRSPQSLPEVTLRAWRYSFLSPVSVSYARFRCGHHLALY